MIDPSTGEELASGAPTKLFTAIRRAWLPIVAVSLLLGIVTYVGSKLETPSYTASGQVFVTEPNSLANTTADIQTVSSLMTSNTVVRLVAQSQGLSFQQVQSHLTAEPAAGGNVVDVDGRANSAAGATRLVNAAYNAFRTVTLDLPSTQARTTYFAAPQTPTAPTAPRPLRNAVIGVLLGLLVSIGVAWVRQMRPTASDVELAAATLGVPLVGDVTAYAAREDTSIAEGRAAMIRALPLDLDELAPNDTRVLALGAARPEDLPPELPLELAKAFAAGGWRTLLIDADTPDGRLSSLMGHGAENGLSDVLRGEVALSDALRHTDQPEFLLLPVGRERFYGAEGHLGKRLSALLNESKDVCDLVLISLPSMAAQSEARLMAARADGVLLVLNDQTPIVDLKVTRDRLVLFRGRLIGFIRDQPPSRWRRWTWSSRPATARRLPPPPTVREPAGGFSSVAIRRSASRSGDEPAPSAEPPEPWSVREATDPAPPAAVAEGAGAEEPDRNPTTAEQTPTSVRIGQYPYYGA